MCRGKNCYMYFVWKFCVCLYVNNFVPERINEFNVSEILETLSVGHHITNNFTIVITIIGKTVLEKQTDNSPRPVVVSGS